MPFDYKKEYKEFYLPPKKPGIVRLPAMHFLAVRGQGDPNEEAGAYKQAVGMLYAVAFTIKMSKMGKDQPEGYFDYVVPPLEGLWWQNGVQGVDYTRKGDFQWISLIRLPEFVTEAFLDAASRIHHLMLVVDFRPGAGDACALLRRAALPYAVYYSYAQETVEGIVSGTLFQETQKLHPIFTVLIPEPGCPDSVRRAVYQAAAEARKSQNYQTIPWELYYDTRHMDEIISDDACCVFFDSRGNLYTPDHQSTAAYGNLFEDGLTPVIRQAYPKAAPLPET